MEAYIKPANYEQIGTKKFEKGIGRKENMYIECCTFLAVQHCKYTPRGGISLQNNQKPSQPNVFIIISETDTLC